MIIDLIIGIIGFLIGWRIMDYFNDRTDFRLKNKICDKEKEIKKLESDLNNEKHKSELQDGVIDTAVLQLDSLKELIQYKWGYKVKMNKYNIDLEKIKEDEE